MTKPPPPAFKGSRPLTPKATLPTKKLTTYNLPMASRYTPAWVEVLRTCHLPTTVVVLDFECFFSADYGMGRKADSLSTIEYVADERFEVLGLANLTVDGSTPFIDYEAETAFATGEHEVNAKIEYLKGKYGPNLEGCTVTFQNAKFDATVLRVHYNLIPKNVIDTLDLARAWNSRQTHGLEDLAKQFELPEKGDTMEFEGLTQRVRYVKPKTRKKGPKMPVQMPLATHDQLQALGRYANNDVARQWELFTILLPRLSNPATELRIQRHNLDLFLRPTLAVDMEHGHELCNLFQAELDSTLAATGHTREEISGDKSFQELMIQALSWAGDDHTKYVKQMKKGPALAIAKTDDQREVLLNHQDARVRALMNARTANDSWPMHINRVERIMEQAEANGGLLPVPLHYYGGHTGRASGGERINLQNLPKNGVLAKMRELLIAPPGYKLVVVDAAAIEARILAWVAGQWDLVEKFAAGAEIYCGFAEKVLGYPVRKPRKSGGIPAIEKRMLWARNSIGKIGVLGCGYGMGQEKIHTMAQGEIDMDMALKIRDTYREENKAIVALWGKIERAFAYCGKYQRPSEIDRGVIRFDSLPDCDIVMTLPNGRELHYLKVKLGHDEYHREKWKVYNAKEHSWEFIWGGTLTENCVQAIARDVLLEAMLRLEDIGIHTALTVHDELVCVVEEDKAEAALKQTIVELSKTPTWAPRMPLAAEGRVMGAYSK